MCKLVCEHMHCQGRHADIRLAAVDALLCRLRVQASVCLLVSREVGRGGVLFAAFGASELGSVGLDGLFFRDRGVAGTPLAAAIRDEEGLVGVGYGFVRGPVSRTVGVLGSVRRLRLGTLRLTCLGGHRHEHRDWDGLGWRRRRQRVDEH